MSQESVDIKSEPYEADRPIRTSGEDRFGRSDFSRRVASVIASRRDAGSIVVGIYGPWGEGKTSVLNMVVEELEACPDILVLTFNPWRFQDESQLINNYFSLLAEKVGKPLKTTGENIGDILRKYSDVLAPFSYLGLGAKDLAKALAAARPAADLEKLKGRVEEMLGEFGKRIVVIMDDIDRLDKDEIQAVFKLVKLTADFPNTAYILAFDEQMVSAALAEKYGSIESGRSFLEKIVQVPLRLPPADSEALRRITFEGVDAALELAGIELSERQVQDFVRIFVRGFEGVLGTPRLAKHYVNGVTFALPLLKDEVNPLDLLVIEAVRTFFPALHASIRDNPAAYLGSGFGIRRRGEKEKDEAEAVIADALKGLTPYDRQAAEHVIRELFPRAAGSFGDPAYGSDSHSRWTNQKRIASDEYFHRYFAYGVPPRDVSDRRINEVLTGGEPGDVDFVKAKLKGIAASTRPETLLAKLRRQEDSLPPEYAVRLALAVAQFGEFFPQDRSVFGTMGFSAFSQAGYLLTTLLKRVEEGAERDGVALRIAGVVAPIPFAIEYAGAVTKSVEDGETYYVISDEAEAEVYRKLGSRIAEEAPGGGIFRKYPKDVLSIYLAWRIVGEEAARQSLGSHIRSRPDDVLLLLEDAMPLSTSGRGTVKRELGRRNYDTLTRLIDPELVVEALARMYGDVDAFATHTGGSLYDLPPAERAAKSFIRIHRNAQQQSTGGKNGTVEDVGRNQKTPPTNDDD